jgi:aryl-alcohol dehydrogenase-like predicted oxidoreductase
MARPPAEAPNASRAAGLLRGGPVGRTACRSLVTRRAAEAPPPPMLHRRLGSTGLAVSPIAFGAGPVSQLLVGDDRRRQLATVAKAVELGIDWFDTAATYGAGRSEENLGDALEALGLGDAVRIATKVRILPEQLSRIGAAARESVEGSLRRLRRDRVTLLQVHNAITARAGAEPTSLTPACLLAPGGLLETMDQLRRAGLVEHLGLTGLGEPAAVAEAVASGEFATVQTPYHVLNPSAGQRAPAGFAATDYGNLIATCQRHGLGVFAIRVLAGGALAGRPPSPHTRQTPFFPLALYEQDAARAAHVRRLLPEGMTSEELAIRFALSHPAVACALIGFGAPDEVADACRFAARGPLDTALLDRLRGCPWDAAVPHRRETPDAN